MECRRSLYGYIDSFRDSPLLSPSLKTALILYRGYFYHCQEPHCAIILETINSDTTVCVDCQTKRTEEQLKKQVQRILQYLDLSGYSPGIPRSIEAIFLKLSPSIISPLPRKTHQAAFEAIAKKFHEKIARY
jgi:hypothetical protein